MTSQDKWGRSKFFQQRPPEVLGPRGVPSHLNDPEERDLGHAVVGDSVHALHGGGGGRAPAQMIAALGRPTAQTWPDVREGHPGGEHLGVVTAVIVAMEPATHAVGVVGLHVEESVHLIGKMKTCFGSRVI